MHENKQIFESMPVPKALATLAIPTIISQLITMIYNLADTFFIGRANNPNMTAAATVAFTLVFIMNGLSNLFGIGGGSLISRLMGQKQEQEAKKVCSFSFYCTIAITALFCLLCIVAGDFLLKCIGAVEDTMPYAKSYLLWVVIIGGIPATLAMTMSHLLRSEGYAKQASFGLGMGGVLNVLLDPLFMFVILKPGNEVTGAAVATMISNVISMGYFILTFLRLRGRTVLSLSPKYFISGRPYAGKILAIGFPSALGCLLACVANIAVNVMAVRYSVEAQAALGIVKRIDTLPMNVGMGLCQGMMPLVAYNYAAGNYKRMRSFTNAARTAGIIFAGLCIVCFELLAEPIVKCFIREEVTLAYGVEFLRICCIATPLMICNFQMAFTFQAMGRGKESLILSACRQGIINLPLLFLLDYLFGLYGVVWTQLVSDVITYTICLIVYQRIYKKLIAK